MLKTYPLPSADTLPHLREFVEYINQHPYIEPIKAFQAGGYSPAQSDKDFYPPFGVAFLYPEFLAFLTTRKPSRGMLEKMVEELPEFGTDVATVIRLFASEGRDVGAWIGAGQSLANKLVNKYKDKELVVQAFTNKYSFFIPLTTVMNVQSTSATFLDHQASISFISIPIEEIDPIRYRSPMDYPPVLCGREHSYRLCEYTKIMNDLNPIVSLGPRLYHMARDMFGEWQPDVVQFLEKASEKNRERWCERREEAWKRLQEERWKQWNEE